MKYDLEHEDLISIIKSADDNELEELCSDIREFLIQKVSKTGGHLASNLGVVELTVAMHKVYNSPVDKIIYDVGHQTYVHKILTGRADQFDTLRKFKGLSGFPKAYESVHDAYDTGHSSTSLGAAAGYAVARNLKGEESEVVALIGDGAMTGGLVYEALNNIGSNRLKIRIILNDNGMSIAHNVGAMSKHLQRLRSSSNYINAKKSVRSSLNRVPLIGKPISNGISRTKSRIKLSVLDQQGILFEELGIKYIGPIDGYDIPKLIEAFNAANAVEGPTIVHVITTKGKGYSWSEKFPRKFHGVGPFSIDNGNLLSSNNSSSEVSFSEVLKKSTNIAMVWVILSLMAAIAVGLIGHVYMLPDVLVGTDAETVFLIMTERLFTPFVAGLIWSAVLAAIMSTASAQLLVTASAISNDFYANIIHPKASDKELVLVSRIVVLIVALIAIYMAMDPDSYILTMVAYAWAGFGAAFGPAILFSLFWKRMTRHGCIAGIVVGGLTVLIWKQFEFLGLYEIVPGFLFSSIAIYVVSIMGKLPPRPVLKDYREAEKMHVL